MAEVSAKRQSTSGKPPVSTPKSPPPGAAPSNMVSLETALSSAVGTRIRIHTTIERFPTLEGVVILINTNLHVVAFAERPPSTNHHIFALSALKDFELLPKTAFPLPRLPPSGPLAPLDTEASLARANAAVAKMKEKIAKRNPSVTKEAQEIFDAIGRQYPTRWEGKDIIIMDQVIVRGPGYKPEDCRAGKDVQQGVLTRVKKVLENERKRITQSDASTTAKGPKPVVPAIPAIPAFSGGPRKGG